MYHYLCREIISYDQYFIDFKVTRYIVKLIQKKEHVGSGTKITKVLINFSQFLTNLSQNLINNMTYTDVK